MIYKEVEYPPLSIPPIDRTQTGKPPSSLPKALPRPIIETIQMDFFFNLFFGPATAEACAELDSELEQVPVDFEDGGNGGGNCIVA